MARARAAIRSNAARLTAAAALGGVLLGVGLHVAGADAAAHGLWAATTALLLVPLTVSVARRLWHRDVGVDAIALVAMAGALALGEYLAGAVIAVMLAGGNALEETAGRRARRDLTALVAREPRTALVRRDDALVELPVEAVGVGDVVLVRAGEVVPVDGLVVTDEAVLDESALTGEPLPVTVRHGGQVRSGTVGLGVAFEVRALRPAAESAYAALVRLVRDAEREQAPFVRLADRYAAFFLPVTGAVAAVAWAVSGDAVRALAVFVVATPCPLILAAPVAFVSGLSRAARIGVVIKNGGAIERLGAARTVLLDKTGTITLGHPELSGVLTLDGLPEDEVLRLAASLDQVSAHPLAAALVAGAERRGLELELPAESAEAFGRGIKGIVAGRSVVVGNGGWLRENGVEPARTRLDGRTDGATVLVGVDGHLAGSLSIDDRVRDDAQGLVAHLRSVGIGHVALVTGDRTAAAERIGDILGVDRVYADQSPAEKVEVVRALRARPGLGGVVMVGDGINDAPALALADVGIALGTLGATVSSETADAVILVDRVDRVADAIRIGRRSVHIARQSVLGGMAASIVAMGVAAAGYLPPVEGALLQEAIDVAVIVNALRALRD